MEGRCQLTAQQLMSKCGQNANKEGVTMATSHGSPPPGTCHTEFTVENKYTYLDTRGPHEPRGGWDGANPRQGNNAKGKAKTTRARSTAMAQLRMPAAITCWPTADLPVNSDY